MLRAGQFCGPPNAETRHARIQSPRDGGRLHVNFVESPPFPLGSAASPVDMKSAIWIKYLCNACKFSHLSRALFV
jgi:hypothetical protein